MASAGEFSYIALTLFTSSTRDWMLSDRILEEKKLLKCKFFQKSVVSILGSPLSEVAEATGCQRFALRCWRLWTLFGHLGHHASWCLEVEERIFFRRAPISLLHLVRKVYPRVLERRLQLLIQEEQNGFYPDSLFFATIKKHFWITNMCSNLQYKDKVLLWAGLSHLHHGLPEK